MNPQASRSRTDNLRADVQENMALPIGEHIAIYNSQNKRIEGKIAGYEQGHYIMVRVQGHIGNDVDIAIGEKINAHFIRNEFTVAFVSNLSAKFSFEHFFFVAFNYPRRFISSTKRIGSRVDCLLPATIKSEGRLALGVITNVSLKGCQVAFDNQTGRALRGMIVGQSISIFLNPFQTNAPGREVVCSVRYISRGSEGIKLGVSFANVGMNAMHTISEYIKGQQTREVLDALKDNEKKSEPGTEDDKPGEDNADLETPENNETSFQNSASDAVGDEPRRKKARTSPTAEVAGAAEVLDDEIPMEDEADLPSLGAGPTA